MAAYVGEDTYACPSAVLAKTLALPADRCRQLHSVWMALIVEPQANQHYSAWPVRTRQLWPRTAVFQHGQQLPQ
jgi:hypothetical protein